MPPRTASPSASSPSTASESSFYTNPRPGTAPSSASEKRGSQEGQGVRARLNTALDTIKRKITAVKGGKKEEPLPPARRATASVSQQDRDEIQRILRMNNAADITKSLPFNFPPPPSYPGNFTGALPSPFSHSDLLPGKTREEYKEYMRKKALAEEWENALVAYKMRQRQGNKAAMDTIVARLKERLGLAQAPARTAPELSRITEEGEESSTGGVPTAMTYSRVDGDSTFLPCPSALSDIASPRLRQRSPYLDHGQASRRST